MDANRYGGWLDAVINKIRIIGGQWRSRLISFEDAPGLRPTPGRLRETLFNWLQHDVVGSECLDLFAGSGALGFEAASRGAARVVQVELNSRVCACLGGNRDVLNASQIKVVNQNVESYLNGLCGEKFDLVFMDPPFGKAYVEKTCQQLEMTGCLSEYAKIYIEAEKSLELQDVPIDWALLKSSKAGDVVCYLYQRKS